MKKFSASILLCIVILINTKAQDLDWGDFENNVSWWNSWKGTTSVIDNFDFEGNPSAKILKYVPDSLWRGISIYFENPPLNPSHQFISIYAYAENSTAIQLGMPSINVEDTFFVKDTLIAGAWRQIEFDISRLKVYNYKYFIIQTVENTTYYFDNMKVKADPNYTNIDNENALPVKVFPNPTRDYFRVSNVSDKSEIRVLNLAGQEMLKKVIMNDENIPLNGFPGGLYTIEIKSENRVIKTKIIKL